MIYKLRYHWGKPPELYYNKDDILLYTADDVIGNIKTAAIANVTTFGFGVKIERKLSENDEWNVLYDGPVNDIVILGLSCKLKGVSFE